jgi:hypothetical protein
MAAQQAGADNEVTLEVSEEATDACQADHRSRHREITAR